MVGENVVAWAIAGALGGWLGRTLVKSPARLTADLLIGCVGGLLGGWIFSWYGHLAMANLNVGSVVVAFLAAVVLWLAVRLFSVKKTA